MLPDMPNRARVTWLSIAPVKAMALVGLEHAWIGPRGIPGDRRFAVVDDENRLVNGKRVGRLATIVPVVRQSGDGLSLRSPDGGSVDGPVEPAGDPVDATFFGRQRRVRRLRGPFDAALSDWLGTVLHLVELCETGTGVDRALDDGAVSIASVASLADLAHAGGLDEPLDQRRFRMTIGVDGVPPWAEDGWLGRAVRVGEAVVRPLGNVGRCAVTTHDPDTGRPDVDTLRLLREHRGEIDATEALPFGVWGSVVRPGEVRLGDPVEVDPS
jgi:uncharacterized protein YcbX